MLSITQEHKLAATAADMNNMIGFINVSVNVNVRPALWFCDDDMFRVFLSYAGISSKCVVRATRNLCSFNAFTEAREKELFSSCNAVMLIIRTRISAE